MIVNCVLKAFWQPKTTSNNHWSEIPAYDNVEIYHKQDYKVELRLQIIVLNNEYEEVDVLREIKFPYVKEDKVRRNIHFGSISYCYFENTIYCITTIHNI